MVLVNNIEKVHLVVTARDDVAVNGFCVRSALSESVGWKSVNGACVEMKWVVGGEREGGGEDEGEDLKRKDSKC